jgi:glutaredoxin
MKSAGLTAKAESLLSSLESIFNVKFKEGRNPDLKFMTHLWQDVPHSYRPLTFYTFMELLALFCHIFLTASGFERHQVQGVSYYTINLTPVPRKKSKAHQQQQQSQQTPVVFVHGVGIGFLPYLAFIKKLAATGRPLLVPEVKHVSMRLTQVLPGPRASCALASTIIL